MTETKPTPDQKSQPNYIERTMKTDRLARWHDDNGWFVYRASGRWFAWQLS